MSDNTPTTQPTPTTQRTVKMVVLATDFIQAHIGQPISHVQHSRPIRDLLLAAYEMGYQDAQQETLERLDTHIIDPIQKKIDR